jgi:hypothetical protein
MDSVVQQQIEKAQVPGLPAEGVGPASEPISPTSNQPVVPKTPGKNIVIKRATFGDETSTTDVTKTLSQQLEEQGYVDVMADASLVPLVNWGGPKKVELNQQEQEYAQEKAEEECGGGENKSCIEVRKQQQMALMLKEKESKTAAADKIVKGRRLTVTYIDENGKEQTAVIPDGNQFKAGTPKDEDPITGKKKPNPFTPSTLVIQLIKVSTTLVFTFGWVFSVVATYRTFLEVGSRIPGYIATGVAIFFPYSGYFIMLAFFAIKSFFGANLTVSKPGLVQTIAKRPGATVASVIS